MSLVAMLRCNTSSNFLSFALVFWLHNFVSLSLWLLRRAEYWLDGKTDKPVLFIFGYVGTNIWSHSLWLSNGLWTELNVPEFPILRTKVQNSGLSYYWSGWQTPHWSGSQNPSTLLVHSLSLKALSFFSFGSSRAPLHLPPWGCLPSRSLFLGPTSCGDLQAALAEGQNNFSSLQQHKSLPIWVAPSRLAPSCYPCKGNQFPPLLTFIKPCTARTALFSIGTPTFSCNYQQLFFKDW